MPNDTVSIVCLVAPPDKHYLDNLIEFLTPTIRRRQCEIITSLEIPEGTTRIDFIKKLLWGGMIICPFVTQRLIDDQELMEVIQEFLNSKQYQTTVFIPIFAAPPTNPPPEDAWYKLDKLVSLPSKDPRRRFASLWSDQAEVWTHISTQLLDLFALAHSRRKERMQTK